MLLESWVSTYFVAERVDLEVVAETAFCPPEEEFPCVCCILGGLRECSSDSTAEIKIAHNREDW